MSLAALDKYLSYIELLSQVNNSCVFVVEYNGMFQFHYISPNFCTFFGYDPNIINSSLVEEEYLKSRIHPHDLSEMIVIQKRLMELWYEQPIERRLNYKHIYEFRILNSDEKYIRVIFQSQVMEMDNKHNPSLILGVIDLSPNQSSSESLKFRAIDIKKGDIIPCDIDLNTKASLSKRETEILKMVNEGMLSKEISDKLSISIHTVNGHRQKILEKLHVDNIVEAINYARKLRLLD